MLTYAGKTVPNSRNPIINQVIHLYAPLSGPLGSISISVFSQEDKVLYPHFFFLSFPLALS
jgi:hypothetical protein